jgi:hypothetical protein
VAGSFTAVTIERSDAASGPWMAVNGERHDDGETGILLDRSAEAERSYYYRLVATTRAGQVERLGPFAVTAGPIVGVELSVTPSPTRGLARIEFSVAREAWVRLSVIDVQGRSVARVADGVYRAGRYQAAWNATDGARRVPAGLYFVRYEVPGKTSVRRLIVTP